MDQTKEETLQEKKKQNHRKRWDGTEDFSMLHALTGPDWLSEIPEVSLTHFNLKKQN